MDLDADELPVRDVSFWLRAAREAEPGLRLTERSAALDEAEAASVREPATDGPGRFARLEIAAERAIDLARIKQIRPAERLARSVLDEAPADATVARARATEALGRALAWTGTDRATRAGRRLMADAAEQYRLLGAHEWHGYAVFFRGNSIHLQNGELIEAEQCIAESLSLLLPDSPRRATVLTFYCDVLIGLGRWDEAEAPLDEAAGLADEADDPMSRAYVSWARARLASVRGNALATERYVRETERDAADWFDIHTGSTFLADAAEMLDRVGLRDQAEQYLVRAVERGPDDEFVDLARAVLLARGGDPLEALEALQDVVRGDWLEKRQVWRLRMFTAFATLRLDGVGTGALAAEALATARASGTVEVATRGEPEITAALLPLAEAAGSSIARELLVPAGGYLVRLLGATVVARSDGIVVPLPAGQPGELVRMLAVHPQGLAVETVLDWFFPDIPTTKARQRLRQMLTRLRAAVGDLVLRTDDQLILAPAWVDVRAFRQAADQTRAVRGSRAVQLAHAALAVWSGPPLMLDAYADWASSHRRWLTQQYLSLLDMVAADAAGRQSHQEALAALRAAIDEDPDEPSRYDLAAEQLRALGRRAEADRLLLGRGAD